MTIIKMPTGVGRNTPRESSNETSKTIRRPIPKYILCLKLLLERTSEGITELEALTDYGDTCLHSTISYLANNHGIAFERKWEPHTHRNGGETHFKRYWLKLPAQARKLVSLYEPKGVKCR